MEYLFVNSDYRKSLVFKLCIIFSATFLFFSSSVGDKMRVTGTFSTLEYHQEAGDLLGVELRIVWTNQGYQGTIQIAEGGAGNLILLKNINIENENIEFVFDYNTGRKATFEGVIYADGIKGEIEYDTGGMMKLKLKRKKSYWD